MAEYSCLNASTFLDCTSTILNRVQQSDLLVYILNNTLGVKSNFLL